MSQETYGAPTPDETNIPVTSPPRDLYCGECERPLSDLCGCEGAFRRVIARIFAEMRPDFQAALRSRAPRFCVGVV